MECDEKPAVSFDLKPMHSFDLWGVIVDQHTLGQQKIDIYEEIARKEKISEHEITRVTQNYRALLDGKPWATGPRKAEIIDALAAPAPSNEHQLCYDSCFIQDALEVIKEILEAGEGAIIFTSEPAPGLREQLVPKIGKRIGVVRHGNKTDPGSFKAVYDLERRFGNIIITHTADELPELIAARKSGLFQPGALIYVNRNDSNSEKMVESEGIHRYVNDLRNVKYTTLVANS